MNAEVSQEHRLDVPVLRGDRRVMCGMVWRYHPDDSYSIELDSPIGLLTGAGSDRMKALRVIREQLEPHGWLIAVQGARVDAYASGAISQQGGASAIYLVKDGQEVKRRERVPIFDEAPADRLGTLAEQAEHYRRWRASLS